jgi:hypothetical protein
MSAQSLVTSSQYPIIETGAFNTTATPSGSIVFRQPFPTGTVPAISLQNISGSVWDQITLACVVSNTGFTWTQYGASAAEIFSVSYIAILVPNTTP